MGLTGAGSADKDRVTLGIQEGAGGEFTDPPFIDRRIGEDELVDILEDRELGAADTVADRAGLPVGAIGPDQAGDEWIDLVAPGKALAGNLIEAGAHDRACSASFPRQGRNGAAAHAALSPMAKS